MLQPDKSDWHKLANQIFDTTKSSDSVKTDEQVTAPDTVYPTIAQDQGQPATLANADKKFDTVTDQQVVALRSRPADPS